MSLQFFQVFKHKFKSYIHKQTVLYIYCILLNNILYVFKFHDIFTWVSFALLHALLIGEPSRRYHVISDLYVRQVAAP